MSALVEHRAGTGNGGSDEPAGPETHAEEPTGPEARAGRSAGPGANASERGEPDTSVDERDSTLDEREASAEAGPDERDESAAGIERCDDPETGLIERHDAAAGASARDEPETDSDERDEIGASADGRDGPKTSADEDNESGAGADEPGEPGVGVAERDERGVGVDEPDEPGTTTGEPTANAVGPAEPETTAVVVETSAVDPDQPTRVPPAQPAAVVQDPASASPAALRVDFGAHLEANYQRLVAQLYAITLDAGEAHDVVQDAYSRAWRSWSEIGESADPTGWIRRVAVRSTMRSWRAVLSRIGLGRAEPPSADTVDPRTAALLTALGRLPAAERRSVVLFHMVGMSIGDIATLEQVSLGTVQARLSRARRHVVTEGMADMMPTDLGLYEEGS
ncbi:sigma factor-like helix-turn-helix DNA-binding protein [Pseudonocardia sp. H11422]|uniref:sigma factor-like helix-turn-helix DNA-binding protein n=1 Tax=Pseudonocardia sp. H11422 TaxID=2835866 RepID=UPI001BDBB421|nr:sigma factor-like helix-turn-helix DNA-binding protein [Pseudonocardia sp. H11422]